LSRKGFFPFSLHQTLPKADDLYANATCGNPARRTLGWLALAHREARAKGFL
jgi:hypothetical protein